MEEVPSTQDRARAELDRLPVAVIASRQTAGRGRSGAVWLTAPRSLAVSVAFASDDDPRPFSLMAGVAAGRILEGSTLKWPNDVMIGELKVGGILVERASEVVVGFGLNLWWPQPPPGVGSLLGEDPGPELHKEIAGLWVAEVMALVEEGGWPHDEYRSRCVTVGREITWEPEGRGRAVDVGEEGELVVEIEGRREMIPSGSIHHVRG
ncbi:MAG TPA: biotin--[acetyl-CoA-carboxylase] ligase [Acidimicrobiia bacterium]|nr:biotin--[acetyl-CoA-carboxylase] ligase [Acidimicrobiia bacterium]